MDRISDLRTSLCKSLSRDVVEHVAASVAEYPNDIPQLIRLLDDTDNRVAWRAAWACEKLSALSPDRLLPHREEIARRLFRCQHDGTKRLLLHSRMSVGASSVSKAVRSDNSRRLPRI